MTLGRFGRIAARRGGILLGALALSTSAALAQTTTLEVAKDATIRGGSYASRHYGTAALLVTRSSSNDSYVRRAVLTFDTETTVPDDTTIQSAQLVLTVRGGNSETRELRAYGMPTSFDQEEVTWNQRRSGINWSNAGGDVTGTPAKALVRGTAGSQVTFDVKDHVQKVVNGDFGSRYARFLISDPGASSSGSYKEFHSLEASDRAGRPRLVVAYGSGGTSTAPEEGPDPAGDVVLTSSSVSAKSGKWVVEQNSGAVGGSVIRHPDAGLSKLRYPQASPSNYFEMTFTAEAGRPYRMWLRGRADRDHWSNDSVFVQFSGSVTRSGSSVYRIGSTSAAEINMEECSGCGLSGWVWQDNGYGRGVLGPEIYFASSGTHKIRVQTREDGLAIDRIVLSPSTYLSSAPTVSGPAGDDAVSAPAESTVASEVRLAAAMATPAGKWVVAADASAIGGKLIRHPDAGASKVSTAAASPANYFEMTFQAVAGTPYRLWIHGKAENDAWSNDSVHVQFSGSVTSSGSQIYRIGTSSSAEVNLEECSGCGLSGWAWEDNGWGSRGKLGPQIYFASTGTQKIRVQTREDGLAIDQIVLSPASYLTSAPPQTSESSTVVVPAPAPEPAPEPESTLTTSSSTLKVLQWNIYHGTHLSTIATWIAKWKPDVISLNEVQKSSSYDMAQVLADKLKAHTGITYYVNFAQRYGNWSSSGEGNAILSRYRFVSTARETISYGRSIPIGTIVVNGRNVTVMSVHLDHEYHYKRETQVREVQAIASSWGEPRIVIGDFNAWPDHRSYAMMAEKYYDSWVLAAKAGTATSFPGNDPSDGLQYGATKKGRIDYIFHSHGATVLRVKSSHVFDTRNSSGSMPSDHRPLMTVYEVR